MTLIESIITFSKKKKKFRKKKLLPSTLDMVPSPSTWNPRRSTLDKKIDSIKPCKIMTDNQNMNKTSMKDVQHQHFYQTASLRATEMFP